MRRRAEHVAQVDDAIRELGRDMLETMRNAAGIGLAAPQVGVLKRVVTIETPEKPPLLLVNPKITQRVGRRQIEEGCLSVPGYVGLVERAIRVSARYIDEHGDKLQLTAEEVLAQVIEHEIDHLNGILYVDHLKAHQDLARKGTKPDEPHWHDVGYEVHVDHSNEPTSEDREMAEVLRSVVKFSEVRSNTPLEELRYEVT